MDPGDHENKAYRLRLKAGLCGGRATERRNTTPKQMRCVMRFFVSRAEAQPGAVGVCFLN